MAIGARNRSALPAAPPRGGAPRRAIGWFAARRLHVVAAGLLVLLFSLWQNAADITNTRYHPDESRWLNRAYYLRELADPLGGVWEDRYLIRGQPPMGSYVTGIGLLLQGRDLDTNGPWDFNYGLEANVAWNASRGNMPSWDDLEAARRTSAVLGALTALLCFVIVTRLTNWVGGLAAGLFLGIHPLQTYLSSLGVSDALFAFLVALSGLSAYWLARKPTWPRTLLLGVVLGAGASTKLSPLGVAVGLALVGLFLVLRPVLRSIWPFGRNAVRPRDTADPDAAKLGWMLLSLPIIAYAFFVLSYPYLWPAPVERTANLIDFRRAEMKNQARIWPDASIDDRLEAASRTWDMLENRFSASGELLGRAASALGRERGERGYDLPFALAGLLLLIALALRRGVSSPTFLVTATLGGQAAIIFGGLRVDFDRYYLPLAVVFAIGIGVFVAQVWNLVLRVLPFPASRATPDPTPSFGYRPQPAGGQPSAD